MGHELVVYPGFRTPAHVHPRFILASRPSTSVAKLVDQVGNLQLDSNSGLGRASLFHVRSTVLATIAVADRGHLLPGLYDKHVEVLDGILMVFRQNLLLAYLRHPPLLRSFFAVLQPHRLRVNGVPVWTQNLVVIFTIKPPWVMDFYWVDRFDPYPSRDATTYTGRYPWALHDIHHDDGWWLETLLKHVDVHILIHLIWCVRTQSNKSATVPSRYEMGRYGWVPQAKPTFPTAKRCDQLWWCGQGSGRIQNDDHVSGWICINT